ncbi:Smr/MutS family protein [Negadavirga shengliensis]|uniref:Smr/MutS family protein n=1 Tax=Negadavirga shengliensis TaxID=1389218 RepID=A0ABV9SV27_9BACT
MNIGDKVRLLHGTEEGVITKIGAGGQVEIEIEEGFRIPALKSEVVVIHPAEQQFFGTKKAGEEDWALPVSKKKPEEKKTGIFLAYIPYNDQNHGVFIINHTQKDMVFAVSETHGENSKTLDAALLKSGSERKFDEKSIQQFEEWPALHFQFIPLNQRLEKTQKPFEKRVKFKASSFFKNKRRVPILEKEGYVFQMDEQIKELDVRQLNQELNPARDERDFPSRIKRPAKEIDLHIEKLTPDHDLMSNSEKLKLQLETFEQNLNAAIISGIDEITFIHGIGNGVLRKEIHRFLSQFKQIRYYKDSHKTNFGYGATLVKIHE